jgi:hypothetical protein
MQGLLKRADLRWSYDRAFLPDKEQATLAHANFHWNWLFSLSRTSRQN